MSLPAEMVAKLADQDWRMNNLYSVIDESGNKVPFRMRDVQRDFFDRMWYFNAILKSRQHGFTTLICIYMLDTCLFNSNTRCAVVAHDDDDTTAYFRDKIKFPYESLPEELKRLRPTTTDRKQEILFSNNSSIRVTTSGRSGTNNIVLSSELGKTSVLRPDRAREVITGSFETIHKGGMIFVESTARGRYGEFYEICKRAQTSEQRGKDLLENDFKFFFYPWWKDPKNTIDDYRKVTITERFLTYFQGLKGKHKIDLTPEQKAWYVKKEETLQGDMLKEHPSTPDECWQETLDGTYFATQFRFLRENKRITSVPYFDGVNVDTWWDIGYSDTNCIWFSQDIGGKVHLIDYYDNSGEALGHYRDILDSKKYRYGRHVGPHDLMKHELGSGKTIYEQAAEVGIHFTVAEAMPSDEQGRVEAARKLLSICWFDEAKCEKGLMALEAYRKEWDERRGCYKDRPLHDWSSHPSDAFLTLAHNHDNAAKARSTRREVRQVRRGGTAVI